MADFPTAFTTAVDGSTDILAKHLNNVEAKIGIDSSAVTTSHDYKLSGVTGTDKAVSKTGTETLTNKTLTTPVINGVLTGTMTPPSTFYGTNFNPPENFLMNGKIVPSVASNNLTVALKTMAGDDPSATSPVYIRIGSTIRSVTAALSVTKNAGTNWCNAGSAELATYETDYFAYIGYNATDGVVIGFSRIPYANLYSDFSATTTAESYCGISTISNAAAGDNYVNVGRFAATLSAGAGYTWTVPTYTAANLIQRPIYETRWTTYATVATGFLVSAVHIAKYKIANRILFVRITCSSIGSSNAVTYTLTLPFTVISLSGTNYLDFPITFYDNSSESATFGRAKVADGASTINLYTNASTGAWTDSNNKQVTSFSGFYEI